MPPIHPLHPAADSAGSGRSARRRRSVPIALLCALDAVLRDALTTDLLLDDPELVALRYDTIGGPGGPEGAGEPDGAEGEGGGLRRLVLTADGVLEDEAVVLEHECISCAMRLDALPVIERLLQAGHRHGIVLVLPVAADPRAVAGALGAELSASVGPRRAHVASVTALVDADRAREDLLDDDLLAERGLCWAPGDRRAVGEALAAQIEYADLVVTSGEADAAGAELIEHLRGEDQLLVRGPHALAVPLLLEAIDHDPRAAEARVDPRQVGGRGGPSAHGTWTMDLASPRPLHPERFLARIEQLGGGALRGRGRFWLPTRPHSICQCDGSGGQVSIGVIGDSGAELPDTRLVITGIRAQDRQRVQRAFEECLLTDAEWDAGLACWLGRDDGMSPWLGEHRAAS